MGVASFQEAAERTLKLVDLIIQRLLGMDLSLVLVIQIKRIKTMTQRM